MSRIDEDSAPILDRKQTMIEKMANVEESKENYDTLAGANLNNFESTEDFELISRRE